VRAATLSTAAGVSLDLSVTSSALGGIAPGVDIVDDHGLDRDAFDRWARTKINGCGERNANRDFHG
jgi:hypothetical protein